MMDDGLVFTTLNELDQFQMDMERMERAMKNMTKIVSTTMLITNDFNNNPNMDKDWMERRESAKCFDETELQCVETFAYYFECCEGDCCMKMQPQMQLILVAGLAIAIIIALSRISFCIWKYIQRRKSERISTGCRNYSPFHFATADYLKWTGPTSTNECLNKPHSRSIISNKSNSWERQTAIEKDLLIHTKFENQHCKSASADWTNYGRSIRDARTDETPVSRAKNVYGEGVETCVELGFQRFQ